MGRTFTSRQVPLGAKRAAYERATRYAGQPVLVDPAPAREHVLELLDLRLTVYSIARDAGVSDEVVYRLINNITNRLRVRHAHALMAVTHHPNPRQVRVLAIGAARRLRALAAIGWSWKPLAEHTGINSSSLSTIINDGRTTITWQTWVTIRDTYETLSGTPTTGLVAERMRRTATTKGWPAPLDWEGHDIDDPRVTVVARPWEPRTAKEVAAERAVLVAELTGKGLSAKEIAGRLGVTSRTVVRDRVDLAVTAA